MSRSIRVAKFLDVDNNIEVISMGETHSMDLGLTVEGKLSCVNMDNCNDPIVEPDVQVDNNVITLCSVHLEADGFWLIRNPDIPTMVNGCLIENAILLSQASDIHIGDRHIKYFMLTQNTRGSFEKQGEHGFSAPPPKPHRQSQGACIGMNENFIVQPDVGETSTDIDQSLIYQIKSPLKIAELAASITLHQIFLHSDALLSSSEVDDVFKSFKEVANWEPNCLRSFINSFNDGTRKTRRWPDKPTSAEVIKSTHQSPLIQLFTTLLQVTMEPVSYNILWLKLLSVCSRLPNNHQAFMKNRTASVVLGCMSGHSRIADVQRYGCELLSNLASYKPGPNEKGPIRESAVELILQALRMHSTDVSVIRNGVRTITNLAECYSGLINQLLTAVQAEEDEDLEESLAKAISILDYIGDSALPIICELSKKYENDETLQSECQRLCVFFIGHGVPDIKPHGQRSECTNSTREKNSRGKKKVHFDDSTIYYDESDSSDSSEEDSSFAADIVLQSVVATKLQNDLAIPDDNDSEINLSGPTDPTNKIHQEMQVISGVVAENIDQNKITFLPATGVIGALGKNRRASPARKKGIRAALKRKRPLVINQLTPLEDENQNGEIQSTAEIEKSLPQSEIDIHGPDESACNIAPPKMLGILQRSDPASNCPMEALITGAYVTSNAKGAYVKARSRQYIKNLETSRVPVSKRHSYANKSTEPENQTEECRARLYSVDTSSHVTHGQGTIETENSSAINEFDELSIYQPKTCLESETNYPDMKDRHCFEELNERASLEDTDICDLPIMKHENLEQALLPDKDGSHLENNGHDSTKFSEVVSHPTCSQTKTAEGYKEAICSLDATSVSCEKSSIHETEHEQEKKHLGEYTTTNTLPSPIRDQRSNTGEDNCGTGLLFEKAISPETAHDKNLTQPHKNVGATASSYSPSTYLKRMDSYTGVSNVVQHESTQIAGALEIGESGNLLNEADITIHNLRVDHSFLTHKMRNRLMILKHVHHLFEEEGDNLVNLHQMEFILKFAVNMSDANTDEVDTFMFEEDPALWLDIISILICGNLSTECFLKVIQCTVELFERVDNPFLIGIFCKHLSEIIKGPMAASIAGGLGFFTMKRLHKELSVLHLRKDFHTWEHSIQDNVSKLHNHLDKILVWK